MSFDLADKKNQNILIYLYISLLVFVELYLLPSWLFPGLFKAISFPVVRVSTYFLVLPLLMLFLLLQTNISKAAQTNIKYLAIHTVSALLYFAFLFYLTSIFPFKPLPETNILARALSGPLTKEIYLIIRYRILFFVLIVFCHYSAFSFVLKTSNAVKKYLLSSTASFVLVEIVNFFGARAFLWKTLSVAILNTNLFLLRLLGLPTVYDFSSQIRPIVGTSDFSIAIAYDCAGLEGITLFLVVMAIMLVLEWKNVNKFKAAIFTVIGLLAMIAANISRIFVLILIGHFYDPVFALGLFHTWAGTILYAAVIALLFLKLFKHTFKSKKTDYSDTAKKEVTKEKIVSAGQNKKEPLRSLPHIPVKPVLFSLATILLVAILVSVGFFSRPKKPYYSLKEDTKLLPTVEKLSAYKKFTEKYPENTKAHLDMAKLYVALHNENISKDDSPLKSIFEEESATEAPDYLTKAIATYQAVLDNDPKNTEALKELAKTYTLQGAPDKTLKSLMRATEIAPEDPENYKALATFHLSASRIDEAKAAAEKAVSLGTKDGDTYLLLGHLYDRTGKMAKALYSYKQAAEAFKKAKDPVKESYARTNMTNVYLRSGLFFEAVEEAGKAVRLSPADVRTHLLMAAAYKKLGLPDKIISTLTKNPRRDKPVTEAETPMADQYNKMLGDTYALLGEAYLQKGERQKAIESLRNARRFGVDIKTEVLEKIGTEDLRLWEQQIAHLTPGTQVTCTINGVTPLGLTVGIEGDIEGYIAPQNVSWTELKPNLENIYSTGDTINAEVIGKNPKTRTILLGIKQLTPDPWEEIIKEYSKGEVVTGRVSKLESHGARIDLGEGVEGFVSTRDLSWTKNILLASDVLSEDQEIEAIVLAIDTPNRKIDLGIKQLKPDPWETIEEKYFPGEKFTGTIIRVSPLGVHVELEKDLEGLYPTYRIDQKIRDRLEDTFPPGDAVTVKINEVDSIERKITITIQYTDTDE